MSPTPTATAPAASISGDPRTLNFSEPVRQAGAPCGFVDLLDFPLDPPDGAGARGGSDFARFRDRYDGFHTGEDWGVGASSFGKPVYSIGHGRVTYAQPNGWGADKGVVIVEHTFRDRGRLYSFYGHLHPPSIELRAGTCVERGDLLGAIGDPRSPPHMHFEIRSHSPDVPGPGYWPRDPTLSGWLPPSALIWNERISASVGVNWARLIDTGSIRLLGRLDANTFMLLAGKELIAGDYADGTEAWSRELPENANDVLLDGEGTLIYLLTRGGAIEAFQTSEFRTRAPLSEIDPLWRMEIELVGAYDLVPLPGGGIVVSTRSSLLAISQVGELLWRTEATAGIIDWAHVDGALIAVTRDRDAAIWIFDEKGASPWKLSIKGQRVVASEQPFIYAEDGVYRIDFDTQSAELFYSLPQGFTRSGDMVQLPDGGLLVAHTDLGDKRLIALDAGGELRWERSIADLPSSGINLMTLGSGSYMLTEYSRSGRTGIDMFHIDLDDGDLTRIFSAGSRSANSAIWASAAGDETVLLGIGGVGLAAFDPSAALDSVSREGAAP